MKRWNVTGIVDKSVENLRHDLAEPAALLQAHEVVAFPTETVYGLGASAFSDEAVSKIFEAKGRPSDNPLIVHISVLDQLDEIVSEVPEQARQLMDAFWPGPLTLVLPAKDRLSKKVTAGLDTVGVRMPDHPVALALIQQADLPLAAPSANRSGRPSPTTADHVIEDLEGRIAGVVDGGPTGIGVESTVIDVTGEIPIILRPGGISLEQVKEVTGAAEWDPGLIRDSETPRSPGMKYRHYAPEGEMWLVGGHTQRDMIERINHEIRQLKQQGKKIGVLTTEENQTRYPEADLVVACGNRNRPETIGRHLYNTLRRFDREHVDIILSETFEEKGMGAAVMNRLRKASGGKYL
ncbi:MAG: threonylcarbamoyl-AMP synthase [Bacillaceae bacterium]|nr:threonylcarbamoyl-AMP synthase [Bacillaceae bacterium]